MHYLFALMFSSALSHSLPTMKMPHAYCSSAMRANFARPYDSFLDTAVAGYMLAAVPKIEVEYSDSKVTGMMKCASSVVSDEGHLLTAGHCFENCLQRKGGYFEFQGISAVHQEAIKKIRCRVKFEGKLVDVEVLATNNCTSQEADQTKNHGVCEGHDFALVKVLSKSFKPYKCLKISERVAQVGQDVAAVGFPDATHRRATNPTAEDSDGEQQFATYGAVRPFSPTCELNPLDGLARPAVTTGLTDRLEPIYRSRSANGLLIQASTDSIKGISGGPLLSSKGGAIVGIASRSFSLNSPERECRGSALFVSVHKTLERIAMDYQGLDLKKAFACNKLSF